MTVQVDCIGLIREGSGMKIAIVDDIKGEAERLSDLVAHYLSTHGLFCDQTDLFASGEAFLEHFEPARPPRFPPPSHGASGYGGPE